MISKHDCRTILRGMNSTKGAYEYATKISHNVINNIMYIGNFEFIYNDKDQTFTINQNGKIYDNPYKFLIDNIDISTYPFFINFDMDGLYQRNDLNELLDLITLDKSIIYAYDKDTKKFSHSAFQYSWYKNAVEFKDKILEMMNNKIPFRVETMEDGIGFIYVGNIDGEYKMYDPFNYVNDKDQEQLKIYELMKIV